MENLCVVYYTVFVIVLVVGYYVNLVLWCEMEFLKWQAVTHLSMQVLLGVVHHWDKQNCTQACTVINIYMYIYNNYVYNMYDLRIYQLENYHT